MELIIQKADNNFAFMGKRAGDNLVIPICGGAKLEEGNAGFSPMELMLLSVGGCMSIDIINILTKQRQTVDTYSVKLIGNQADATPAVFQKMTLQIDITGDVKSNKVDQAIQMSKDTYCSALQSMRSDLVLDVSYTINGE